MDSKISNLTLVTTLDGADVLPIVNGGSTKKVTVTKIQEGLATTTYVDTQDNLKVDKVVGKGLSTEDYTTTEKNKLAGIADGAEVNVNADWNAVSGDAQILNKPTIPTAITQTSQLTNNGADGVNPFITALDIPTAGQASTLVREVKNMTGATLTKGTVVYISGANGNKALVSKALATTDALSSQTFGMLQSDILDNGLGNCVIIGDLTGLNTSAFTDGDQLYLSGITAGTFTNIKTLAPTHLVYIGKVTRSHPTLGQVEVSIQNFPELEELHDVQIITPLNNEGLFYETTTDLWKNKSIATVLGYTPANDLNVIHKIGDETILGTKTFSSNPKIPINGGNSGIGALVIENGTGQLEVATNFLYPNLVEIQNVKGVTSSIQTQFSGKQDTLVSSINIKSINGNSILGGGNLTISSTTPSQSAFTVLANNTNATAVPTEQVFKDVAEQVYAGATPTWTGITAPSGATNHSYQWSQIGKIVNLRVNLDYFTAGSSLTAVTFDLPSDCPSPKLPAGVSANGDVICYGSGMLTTTRASVGAPNPNATSLRIKGTGTYEINIIRTTAASHKYAYATIQYFAQ